MLETLRCDQTLDAGGLGVGFLAFALGLDFTADDEFADLRDSQTRWVSVIRSVARPIGGNHASALLLLQIGVGGGRAKEGKDGTLTSSFPVKLKNLRILVARFGPNRFGCTLSVNPGISPSPCLMTLSASTARSAATMQPRTLFLLLSPVRRGR